MWGYNYFTKNIEFFKSIVFLCKFEDGLYMLQ